MELHHHTDLQAGLSVSFISRPYVEAEDFAGALSLFSGSQDEFDLWFKRRLADSTGLDLNTPPSGPMPELLSSYTA